MLAWGLSLLLCFVYFYGLLNEMYLESCQTEMELFAKIVNEWKLLSIFKNIRKSSILDVW